MAYEIINAKRSKSTITVVGNTATLITLDEMLKAPVASPATEIITSASIASVISSSDGFWRIYRGDNTSGALVLELQGNNNLPLYQNDITIANSANANIYVTNSGAGGTLILQVSKTATFTVDPETGQQL